MRLGKFPWCGSPFRGWDECPNKQRCISGECAICEYQERRSEYYGEMSIYGCR